MAAAEVPDLTNIYSKSWYVDVKKDHPKDYDPNTVKALIPEGTPTVDGLGSLDKEALFTEILGYEYSSFQNQSPEIEGNIKVSGTGLEYDYKVFSRNEDAPKNIAKYLSDLEKNIVCFTDTARDGYALIANWPYEDLFNGPNIFHAHTRESENDPAGKMNVPSAPAEIRDNFKKRFYYEKKNQINSLGLLYPASSLNPNDNTDKLADFYSKYTIELILNGIKSSKKKTLNVELTIRDFPEMGKKTKVEGDMNKAGYFQKFLETVKGAFGNKVNLENKKKAIFIGKYHGDTAQVLSAHRNIELTSYDGENTIQTKDMFKAFESYDINTCVRALLEGVDIVFMHTWRDPQTIIVFRNTLLRVPSNKLGIFLNRVVDIMQKYVNQYNLYKASVEIKNKQREIFFDKFDDFITNIKAKTESLIANEKAINELYRETIKGALSFSFVAYIVPNEVYSIPRPEEIPQDIQDLIKKYTHDINPNEMENLAADIYVDQGIVEKHYKTLIEKYKIPEDFVTGEMVIKKDENLPVIQLEKDFIYERTSKTLSLEDTLKMIDLTYGDLEGRRIVSLQPKLISYFGADKLLSIYSKLRRFSKPEGQSFADIFLEVLSKIAAKNPTTNDNFQKCLTVLKFKPLPQPLQGGRRRITRKKGGKRQTQTYTMVQQNNGKTYPKTLVLRLGDATIENNSVSIVPQVNKSINVTRKEKGVLMRIAAEKRDPIGTYLSMVEDFVNDSKNYLTLIKNTITESSEEKIRNLVLNFVEDKVQIGGVGAGTKRGRNEKVIPDEHVSKVSRIKQPDIIDEDIMDNFLLISPTNVIYEIFETIDETLERLSTLRRGIAGREKRIEGLKNIIQAIFDDDIIANMEEKNLADYYSYSLAGMKRRETHDAAAASVFPSESRINYRHTRRRMNTPAAPAVAAPFAAKKRKNNRGKTRRRRKHVAAPVAAAAPFAAPDAMVDAEVAVAAEGNGEVMDVEEHAEGNGKAMDVEGHAEGNGEAMYIQGGGQRKKNRKTRKIRRNRKN